jgi:hypothetical protein
MAAEAPIQNNDRDNDYDDEDDGDDDVCRKTCVSDYSISNPEYQDRDEQKCDDPLTKPYEFGAECFKADTDHARFYKKIGKNKWMTYVPIILESFIYKCHLNNTHETNVFRKVLNHFDRWYGAISIHINNHQRENYKYCGDMIRFYKIKYRDQVHLKDFFHITLHTEKPRHIFFQTRNRSACAAWPRRYGDKKGSLHYRIDATSKTFDPALRPENNKKPYKPFVPIVNAKLASSPANRFIQSDQWGADLESNRTLSVIHEYLYIQFIRHWNLCITAVLDDVSIESRDAPWHGSSNNRPLSIEEQDLQLHHFEIAIRDTLGAIQEPGNLFIAIPSVQNAYDDIVVQRQQIEATKAKNKKVASSMANQIRKQREGKITTLKNVSHVTEKVADPFAIATAAVSSAISATQVAVAELATASAAISSASISASPAASATKVGKNATKTQKKKQGKQNQQSLNNGSASAASLPRLNSLDNFIRDYTTQHHRLPAYIKSSDQLREFLTQKYEEATALEQAEKVSQQAMANLFNEEAKQATKNASKKQKAKQKAISEEQNDLNSNGLMSTVLEKFEHQPAKKQAKKKGKRGGSTRKRRAHHRRTRKRRVYHRRTHKK